MDRCRECTRPIRWERTWPAGKAIALDRDPTPDGNVRVIGLDDATEIGWDGDLQMARVGAAVVLTNRDTLSAARGFGWELYTVHRATCPTARAE